MKRVKLALPLLPFLFFHLACDDDRVYDVYFDFDQTRWPVAYQPEFKFQITDTTVRYDLYCHIRNASTYNWSRIFLKYALQDTSGNSLRDGLISHYLFDPKTGKPFGRSGLGDVFDHQILLLKDYRFESPGNYTVKFEQYMRTDSLEGVLAVGLRVEAPDED